VRGRLGAVAVAPRPGTATGTVAVSAGHL